MRLRRRAGKWQFSSANLPLVAADSIGGRWSTGSRGWDTSTLTPSRPSERVYRAIDDDDVQGWNATDQRWELAKSAMQEDHVTPSDKSGFGWSVFVEDFSGHG